MSCTTPRTVVALCLLAAAVPASPATLDTPRGLPEWGTVAHLEASRWAAGTAYAVVYAHRLGDFRPYLWKTTDYGASWTSLAGGLAGDVYLHVLREDTRRRGMLFLGTERGVAYSLDDGATWEDLRLNPPPPAVRWGYARVLGSEAGAGKNPPRGAIVDYYLEEPVAPEALRLEVFDAGGRLVRALRGVPEPLPIGPEHPDWPAGEEVKAALTVARGVNRAVWDLRWDGAGYLPAAMIDWGDPGSGPLALPGEYRLRLTAGERRSEATLTVEPDPRTSVPGPDIEAQLEFALELRGHIRRVIALVEEIRSLSGQLRAGEEALVRLAGGGPAPRLEALVELGLGIRDRLAVLEARLHNPRAEVSYDILAQPGGAPALLAAFPALELRPGRRGGADPRDARGRRGPGARDRHSCRGARGAGRRRAGALRRHGPGGGPAAGRGRRGAVTARRSQASSAPPKRRSSMERSSGLWTT